MEEKRNYLLLPLDTGIYDWKDAPWSSHPLGENLDLNFRCCKTWAMPLGCLSRTKSDPAQRGATRAISLSFGGDSTRTATRAVCTGKPVLPPRAMSKNVSSCCHIQGSAFLGPNNWNCGNFISFSCHHPNSSRLRSQLLRGRQKLFRF